MKTDDVNDSRSITLDRSRLMTYDAAIRKTLIGAVLYIVGLSLYIYALVVFSKDIPFPKTLLITSLGLCSFFAKPMAEGLFHLMWNCYIEGRWHRFYVFLATSIVALAAYLTLFVMMIVSVMSGHYLPGSIVLKESTRFTYDNDISVFMPKGFTQPEAGYVAFDSDSILFYTPRDADKAEREWFTIATENHDYMCLFVYYDGLNLEGHGEFTEENYLSYIPRLKPCLKDGYSFRRSFELIHDVGFIHFTVIREEDENVVSNTYVCQHGDGYMTYCFAPKYGRDIVGESAGIMYILCL